MPKKMRSYRLKHSGNADVLKISEIDRPSPDKPDEVLIKVRTIGLNYAEVLSRKGQYSWAPPRPYTPGMECFGEVIEVGPEVSHVKPGDMVIAGGQFGSYAEYKVAPAHLVFKSVEGLTDIENAAFLVNFMTAWVVLAKQAKLDKGETALIHAAAGGVGTAAVQIAAAMGAKVIGTAGSDSKLALINKLGAEMTINYRKDNFYDIIRQSHGGVDMVLEVVGGSVYRDSLKLLNPFGRICVAGYASIPLKKWNPVTWWKTWKDAPKAHVMNMAKGSQGLFATHIGYLTENKALAGSLVDEVRDFAKKNNIKPVVGSTFAFDQIPEAHTHMESRKSHGKIVIKLD